MIFLELLPPILMMLILGILAFFQGAPGEVVDILGKFNTPLSVGITLWFCKVIFSAWREDAAKAREDSQRYFDTLKGLLTSLENERKIELREMTESFDNLASSIRELVTTKK